jgi:SAM-dependent methyltransferase
MKLAARFLPEKISSVLFGNRTKHGLTPILDDPEWQQWQLEYLHFYNSTQKKGIGSYVNDAGYQIIKGIDFSGLSIAEIGPGSLPHRDLWNGLPSKFTGIDINQYFLDVSEQKAGCLFQGVKIAPHERSLPLPDESIDILLSFYSLEHLNPLGEYLDEYRRVLKPGGKIVGAIPNEGGLAWGLGRYLTSRRWIHANTKLDYDKIICWEHPNFADTIISELDKRFVRKDLSLYPPMGLLGQNFTLLTRFIYERPSTKVC